MKHCNGVEYNTGDVMKCNRCFNKNRFFFRKVYCPICNVCYYCLKCAHISIFKVCESVDNNFEFIFKKVDYKLNYKLTTNQKKLSDSVVRLIETTNVFVNATCGAGKTEIIFEVVKRFVNSGKKVAFVSPRVEVTIEIYYRFNRAFSEEFGIITGKLKIYQGSMVFLTCHALMNFQNFFDLIIIDEVDAFPFANDKILKNSVKLALKDYGKLIYMSATPTKIDKSFHCLSLNERYHKMNVPIPEYIKMQEHVKEIVSSGRWLVFFPTIKSLEEAYEKHRTLNVIVCHSKVASKVNILDSVKTNFIIFSTAILERGITIANVNVIVYDASHKNFTKSTLIQICGRVGRVLPFSNGKIFFMTNTHTYATRRCIKYLEGLND